MPSLKKVSRSLCLVSATCALVMGGVTTGTASAASWKDGCEVWTESIGGKEHAKVLCNDPGGELPLVYRAYANCEESPGLIPGLLGKEPRIYSSYGGYVGAGEVSSTYCTPGDRMLDVGAQAQ